MNLILASSSPRRRELLAAGGLTFRIAVPDIEEVRRSDEPPEAYVQRLATEKASEISKREPQAWVVGADTTVWIDGAILEKPRDRDEAASMLKQISGREHVVFTGVCLMNGAAGESATTVTASRVRMLPIPAEDIGWYVDTGEPLDKAGSYAVQGIGGWFIESIDGSYTNVVGLPMHTLFLMMKRAGLDPLRDFRT